MSDNLTRIKNEYIQCKKSRDLSLNTINVNKINDYEWTANFIGPKTTGYQGGLFKIIIKIPKEYPTIGPEMRFKYPVFHPNVQCFDDKEIKPEGYFICSSYINNWKIDSTIERALISIYNLMMVPTPSKGYNNEAKRLLDSLNGDSYNEKYKKKCNEWVRKYSTINNN